MSEFQSPVDVTEYPNESNLGQNRFKSRRQVRISGFNHKRKTVGLRNQQF